MGQGLASKIRRFLRLLRETGFDMTPVNPCLEAGWGINGLKVYTGLGAFDRSIDIGSGVAQRR